MRLALIWGFVFLFPMAAFAEPPFVISLEGAIDKAVASSTDLKIAKNELDAADSRVSASVFASLPGFKVDYTAMRFDREVDVPFFGVEMTLQPAQIRSASVSASQTISGLFVANDRYHAASKGRKIDEISVEDRKTDAAFAAAQLYYQGLLAKELVRIADSSLGAAISQRRTVSDLVQSGRLMRADLLKVAQAKEETEAALAKARANEAKVMGRFRILLGMGLKDDLHLDASVRKRAVTLGPDVAADHSLVTLEAIAIDRRSDLQKVDLGIEISQHKLALARWNFVPDVSFFAKADHFFSVPPFGALKDTKSMGISVTWMLWDKGQTFLATEEAYAAREKLKLEAKKMEDGIRLEIQGLLEDLGAAELSIEAAEAAVQQAEEAYRLDEVRFGTGQLTTTEFIVSANNRTRAQGGYVGAKTERDLICLALQKAMGANRPL